MNSTTGLRLSVEVEPQFPSSDPTYETVFTGKAGAASFNTVTNEDLAADDIGHWLVRSVSAIPAPGTHYLVGIAVFWLLGS